MAQQVVNNGDTGFEARSKINDNFSELYATDAALAGPGGAASTELWIPNGAVMIDTESPAGSYADAIAHSPCLRVEDYVPKEAPDDL